jgi:hypothetical protein
MVDAVPDINLARLRGHLAENRVALRAFALEANVAYTYLSRILSGTESAGGLTRVRLAHAAQLRGWEDVAVVSETADVTA